MNLERLKWEFESHGYDDEVKEIIKEMEKEDEGDNETSRWNTKWNCI